MEDTAIRPVRDRVTDVLAEDKTHGFVEGEFLRRLLDEGARAQEQTGRNLHRLLAIAAVFVLLGQASISSISLSGLEIRDLRPIQIVLPSVIMFLLFEVCIGTAAEMAIFRSSDHFMRQLYPKLYESDLHTLLHPRGPAGVEYLFCRSDRTWRQGVLLYGNAMMRALAILTAIGFEVYAYWVNFSVFGAADVLVWLSVVISGMFAVRAIAVFGSAERTPLFRSSQEEGT